MTDGNGPFRFEDDPALPGWKRWDLADPGRFNSDFGPIHVRAEGAGARVRMLPGHGHSNIADHVHGGAMLGFIDMALFSAARAMGIMPARSVTLDLTTHFVGAGRLHEPLDAVVELVRETGSFLFLRGLLVQGEDRIADFSGTLRKLRAE